MQLLRRILVLHRCTAYTRAHLTNTPSDLLHRNTERRLYFYYFFSCPIARLFNNTCAGVLILYNIYVYMYLHRFSSIHWSPHVLKCTSVWGYNCRLLLYNINVQFFHHLRFSRDTPTHRRGVFSSICVCVCVRESQLHIYDIHERLCNWVTWRSAPWRNRCSKG